MRNKCHCSWVCWLWCICIYLDITVKLTHACKFKMILTVHTELFIPPFSSQQGLSTSCVGWSCPCLLAFLRLPVTLLLGCFKLFLVLKDYCKLFSDHLFCPTLTFTWAVFLYELRLLLRVPKNFLPLFCFSHHEPSCHHTAACLTNANRQSPWSKRPKSMASICSRFNLACLSTFSVQTLNTGADWP